MGKCRGDFSVDERTVSQRGFPQKAEEVLLMPPYQRSSHIVVNQDRMWCVNTLGPAVVGSMVSSDSYVLIGQRSFSRW